MELPIPVSPTLRLQECNHWPGLLDRCCVSDAGLLAVVVSTWPSLDENSPQPLFYFFFFLIFGNNFGLHTECCDMALQGFIKTWPHWMCLHSNIQWKRGISYLETRLYSGWPCLCALPEWWRWADFLHRGSLSCKDHRDKTITDC